MSVSVPRLADLSHFDASGQASMVDVGDKAVTRREAVASGHIRMQPSTRALIAQGNAAKGDVLGIARLAGIMAAKRTSELIPLCHPIALSKVAIDWSWQGEDAIACRATVRCEGWTGVEMEALTAVQIALLTVYDMVKAVDRAMSIHEVRLLEKSGGRSGSWSAPPLEG